MSDKKPVVVMTAAGRAKEYAAGSSIREVLEAVHSEHMTAGSNWDRPDRLFVGGECIVPSGLADIAWEYGKFLQEKDDEFYAAIEGWVSQRLSKVENEAA